MLANSPKIAVVGTINRDTIIRADGRRVEGFGGILYNLSVVSQLLPESTLLPVVNLGSDLAAKIRRRLQQLKGIDLQATRVVAKPNNHCLLTYHDIAAKTEILRGGVGAVNRRQLSVACASDFVLVNFISGSDISTRNLRWLRENSSALIYLDFHSRTLGRKHSGERYLRRPRDWRETIGLVDFIQMNDVEFALLSGTPAGLAAAREFFRVHLAGTCTALLLTLGERGCICVRNSDREVVAHSISVTQDVRAIDTTGCGDIFAAAFICAYYASRNHLTAARFATATAAARAGSARIEDLNWQSLRQVLTQIPRVSRRNANR